MRVNQSKNPPGEAIVHPMGSFRNHITFLFNYKADMAGGAGWRGEVLAYCPGNRLEVPLFAHGIKYIPMLAHLVDFINRYIRSFVALGAGIRLPGHLYREPVPGVTGGT